MRLPIAILAGGLATRLRPLTDRTPKSLVTVAGKPFIEHQLELLSKNGIEDVVLCVGHLGEQIVSMLGDGQPWNLKISYVFDGPEQKGTAGALKNALAHLGDCFLIMYGDSYLECDYTGIARAFLDSGRLGLMTVFRNANQWAESNVAYRDGRILRYDKVNRRPDMQHIDYGLGALKANVLKNYKDGESLDLAVVYRNLIITDELLAIEVPTRFYEIGSPEGLEETQRHLLGQENREGPVT
jgi:NDP-sugar pyrophosphorylase family protein